MPLYEYRCEKCGFEFEKLVNTNESSSFSDCGRCGAKAEKSVSSFSSVVRGSSHESADMKIGREANKRWQLYHDRQKKRHSDKNLEKVELPKVNGHYKPVMALGDMKDIKGRDDYSKTLQKHKQDRVKRGQKQFSETGSF